MVVTAPVVWNVVAVVLMVELLVTLVPVPVVPYSVKDVLVALCWLLSCCCSHMP